MRKRHQGLPKRHHHEEPERHPAKPRVTPYPADLASDVPLAAFSVARHCVILLEMPCRDRQLCPIVAGPTTLPNHVRGEDGDHEGQVAHAHPLRCAKSHEKENGTANQDSSEN